MFRNRTHPNQKAWVFALLISALLLFAPRAAQAVYEPHWVIWDAPEPETFVMSAYAAAMGAYPPMTHPDLPLWIEMAADPANRPDVFSLILKTPEYLATRNADVPRTYGVCRSTTATQFSDQFGINNFSCYQLRTSNSNCYGVRGGWPAPQAHNISIGEALAHIAWYNINACHTTSLDKSVCKNRCGTTHFGFSVLEDDPHFRRAVAAAKKAYNDSKSTADSGLFASASTGRFIELPPQGSDLGYFCQVYGEAAVNHYYIAKNRNCSVSGGAWQDDARAHSNWCFGTGAQGWPREQHILRERYLTNTCR